MKHLLRIDQLSREDIDAIFYRAAAIKEKTKRGKPHKTLEGKVLAMIFEKPSTRTRVSFEVGMYQMGGMALFLEAQSTQLGRGESIKDTARVLSRYVDCVMIRAYSQQSVEEFASYSEVPVINGLTDSFHPCQVLGDIFTIKEKLGDIQRVKVVYVGDGNNVANSWVNASWVLGFPLTICCPEGYEPDNKLMERASLTVELQRDPQKAVEGAQVVYTDVWVSMGQEMEEEKRKRVFAPYQLNERLLSRAHPEYLVMHCLPAHRGMEITDGVMDGPHSIVWDQAENRLHIQKAIMEMLILGSHNG